MYRVSFTGYRPAKLAFSGESDPRCQALKKRLLKGVTDLADRGVTEFCSGMALGVDIWAAEAVLELKRTRPQVKLIAVIPCPEQDAHWCSADRERYRSVLSKCDQKICISPKYTSNCMQKRNRALVDMCDILIAVFNGKPGGTAQTVHYAEKVGRKIFTISPDEL